ncbi:MAG: cob(I)yrinic acid a,c-diamide adenosyltransferase [Bacteroidaceae bacterium]|nr:cob(I)yrinic acid a,c-diamide adenosyltransferase [Bacteroidaceae bacterium]
MKRSRVYTRGGDSGTSSLIGGERVKKSCLRLDAYGTIDELSAHIGLLYAMVGTDIDSDAGRLQWIQSRLFDVGTHLAMPYIEGQELPCAITPIHVQQLEKCIDTLDAQLSPLRTFILPGGCVAAAQCHVCRTVCRRAERLIASLSEEVPVNLNLLAFVNRLSDFLFVYARFLNKMGSVEEFSWKNDCC